MLCIYVLFATMSCIYMLKLKLISYSVLSVRLSNLIMFVSREMECWIYAFNECYLFIPVKQNGCLHAITLKRFEDHPLDGKWFIHVVLTIVFIGRIWNVESKSAWKVQTHQKWKLKYFWLFKYLMKNKICMKKPRICISQRIVPKSSSQPRV